MKMTLFTHQVEALRLTEKRNMLLQHDCGTGKTCTALHVIRRGIQNGFGPALVVCPLSIIEAAWLEDAKKFTPDLSAVSLWHEPGPKKAKYQKKVLSEHHDIYVANFETFKSLYEDLKARQFGILIVDESSKMKNYRSGITKALLSLAGIGYRTKGGPSYTTETVIPWRYCLSGTPAPNCEDEYWPQVKFITGRGNDVFSDNFFAFRGRYFFDRFANAKGTLAQGWQIKRDMKEDFNDRLKQVCHVVRKQDAIDLPDQVHEVRHVELSPEERQAYQTMMKELVIEFGDEQVLAASAMTKIMKLRQLTSGFCYGEEGKVYQTGKSKLNELKELLEEIGPDKQVIVWANFRHEIQQLIEALPNSAVLWSDTDDRTEAVQSFQMGKKQYLIANPQSAAHGLTFVNCSYAVYFSQNYSYELQKQSEDRIHRIGQNTKCTYYHLVARGTVDELIRKAIAQKADMNRAILNYLKGNHGQETNTESREAVAV